MNYPSKSYLLQLKVLTPLHIGGAQEKHLKKGIDFFIDSRNVEIIEWDELLNKIDENTIESVCQSFLSGDTRQIQKITYILGIHRRLPLRGNPTDIKRLIRDGLNRPYLPGSSIKGALSSILFHHILGDKVGNFDKVNSNSQPKIPIENSYFGNFSESTMHFIGISDVFIHSEYEPKYYLTKIFSLKRNGTNRKLIGGWKNDRRGCSDEFNDSKFVTAYECFDVDTLFQFRLNVYEGLEKFLIQHNQSLQNKLLQKLNKPDDKDWLQFLFGIINTYTKKYIDKEINYLEKYQYTKKIKDVLELYKQLKNQIPADDTAAVFQIGSGSGFHNITGDWQFVTHEVDWIVQNGRGKYNHRYPAKTRRFAFDQSKIYPMGFVKLSLHMGNEQDISQASTHTTITSPSSFYYYTGKLKEGITVIGKYLGNDPLRNQYKLFKLFIGNPGEEQEVSIRYVADLPPQQLIKVKITRVENGKVISAQFMNIFS